MTGKEGMAEAAAHSTKQSVAMKKIGELFNAITKSVFEDLDRGKDGCTGRVVNDARHHIDDVINNKSIRIAGRVSTRP